MVVSFELAPASGTVPPAGPGKPETDGSDRIAGLG